MSTNILTQICSTRKPPTPPIGRDFSDLAELTNFITALEHYLAAETGRCRWATAQTLADEINTHVFSLAALLLAISTAPALAGEVVQALSLVDGTRFDWALESADLAADRRAFSDADHAEIAGHVWDQIVIVSPQITSLSIVLFELNQAVDCGLTWWPK